MPCAITVLYGVCTRDTQQSPLLRDQVLDQHACAARCVRGPIPAKSLNKNTFRGTFQPYCNGRHVHSAHGWKKRTKAASASLLCSQKGLAHPLTILY